jgi:hypothetical protein
MAQRKAWIGTAAELLSFGVGYPTGDRLSWRSWPKNPRARAGRLRRAQTALRSLGIEIVFTREGKAGTRIINITNAGKIPAPRASGRRAAIHGRIHNTANAPSCN